MIASGTTFYWREDGYQVAGRVIAQIPLARGGDIAVLFDTDERLWVSEVGPNSTAGLLIAGPVTAAQALAQAEAVLADRWDHVQATGLVVTLALGLDGTVYRQEGEGGAP